MPDSQMAETVRLSEAALTLFHQHVERRGGIDVSDSNRAAYRELARAGLRVARTGV
jgi:hypothetical protein